MTEFDKLRALLDMPDPWIRVRLTPARLKLGFSVAGDGHGSCGTFLS